MKLFRRALLLPLVVLLGALVAACVTSGPQKALNDVADALSKNDGGAFLAQLDMKPFATNQIKNMTREDQALNALDSMGRLLGLGGMEDLLGSVVDMQARLQKQYMRGVSTGELVAQCAKADTPDCPWVPESLKSAKVIDLGDEAAIAQVTNTMTKRSPVSAIPISAGPAIPTWAISCEPATSFERDLMFSTTFSTARSMPRFSALSFG